MNRNYFSALFLCTALGTVCAQETYVEFKYDEAGNQRYRGTSVGEGMSLGDYLDTTYNTASSENSQIIDEKSFWKQIRLYPVPVNDILTIDWSDQVDEFIESVSLYQHSTVHWKFQQQNLPDLNKQVKINMAGYDWGVYIIRFTLKDGRIFSKNITKR